MSWLLIGFSELITEERADFLGLNGVLMKPVANGDLSGKIREVLDMTCRTTQG